MVVPWSAEKGMSTPPRCRRFQRCSSAMPRNRLDPGRIGSKALSLFYNQCQIGLGPRVIEFKASRYFLPAAEGYRRREAVAQSIASVSLVVRDYDEAVAFFTECLRFVVMEDTHLGGGKRWVVVAPPGGTGTGLLLARAATPEQMSRVGDQTGGRVFLFLSTDDFWGDYREMCSRGVRFVGGAAERNLRNGGGVSRPIRQTVGIWSSNGTARNKYR